jgi:hypothetical protein
MQKKRSRRSKGMLFIIIGGTLTTIGSILFSLGFYFLGKEKDVPKPDELVPNITVGRENSAQNGRIEIGWGLRNDSEFMVKNAMMFVRFDAMVGQASLVNYSGNDYFFKEDHGQFKSELVYPNLNHRFPKVSFRSLDSIDIIFEVVAEDFETTKWKYTVEKNKGKYSVLLREKGLRTN